MQSSVLQDVFREIVSEIRRFAATTQNFSALQKFAVDLIGERLPHYNWTGFYMLDANDDQTLVLGPFRGAPTEHVRIPITEGTQGETVVIDDVSADPRYLACSIETKSEIVVPIRALGKIVGEIDIDSHELNSFGAEDRRFLEECAEIFGRFFESQPTYAK